MSKFKIGDKVRATSDIVDYRLTGRVPEGTEGIVRRVERPSQYSGVHNMVSFPGYEGAGTGGEVIAWDTELEPVEAPVPFRWSDLKKGDLVTATYTEGYDTTPITSRVRGPKENLWWLNETGFQNQDIDKFHGWTITAVEKAPTPVPTRPGTRVKIVNATYILTSHGDWVNMRSGYVRRDEPGKGVNTEFEVLSEG